MTHRADDNGRRQWADRFSLVWLATLTVGATSYLGASGVLSSDAVAGLLGSVVALASGFTMGGRVERARKETPPNQSTG